MSTLSLENALRLTGRPELAKVAGADTEAYKFHTRDATFITCVKAHLNNATPAVKLACAEYAIFWQISDQVDSALRKLGEYTEPELSDAAYTLAEDTPTGKVRKFAAYNKDSTFEAALAFHVERASYPLAWRKKAAVQLLKRAAEYGTHLPEYIESDLHKAAGFGLPSAESLTEALVQRLNATRGKTAEVRAVNEKLSSLVNTLLESEEACADHGLVKSAMNALEDYDVAFGLTDRYGTDIGLPEEIIDTRYTTDKLQKAAGCSDAVVSLMNGTRVDVTELKKEALAAVDPKLATLSHSELIRVLPTLPQPDANLLTRLA